MRRYSNKKRRKNLDKLTWKLLNAIDDMKQFIQNPSHIPWNNVLFYAEKVNTQLCEIECSKK